MHVRPSTSATSSPLDLPVGPPAVAPLRAVAARPTDPLSLAGLPACVADATAATLGRAGGPADPLAYGPLRARLERAAPALPPRYRAAVVTPLLRTLEQLGPKGFARLLAEDPDREGPARLLLDVAQAVLQRAEGHHARATAAFQEVVWDLYDGFLDAEGRRGVKRPELGVLPPLVRWGDAGSGPYTWAVTSTGAYDVRAPVVSLPDAHARGGLLAWAALPHETVGHDLLAADRGLADELAKAVRREGRAAGVAGPLVEYWAGRIDESASDVLGVLNMGPAAALGVVGYFRGVLGALTGRPALRGDGDAEDPHPADLARAYLAAETVRLLPFEGAARWADRLTAEADRDAGGVLHLGGVAVTPGVAKDSAAAVARAIARTRLASLEGRSLADVQAWSDRDEAVVATLRRELAAGGAARAALPAPWLEGTYAAHVVAAAVEQAASGAATPRAAQEQMIALLARMHDRNPDWAAARAA